MLMTPVWLMMSYKPSYIASVIKGQKVTNLLNNTKLYKAYCTSKTKCIKYKHDDNNFNKVFDKR